MSCLNHNCRFSGSRYCRVRVDRFVDCDQCMEYIHWEDMEHDAELSLPDDREEIPFSDDEDFSEEEMFEDDTI